MMSECWRGRKDRKVEADKKPRSIRYLAKMM